MNRRQALKGLLLAYPWPIIAAIGGDVANHFARRWAIWAPLRDALEPGQLDVKERRAWAELKGAWPPLKRAMDD